MSEHTEQLVLDNTEVLEERVELSVQEIVESLVTEEEYNAYGVHKIINKVFEIVGHDRVIKPQMMYNYSRNSLIEKGRGAKNTNHLYTDVAVKAFVTKWANKQINK